MQYFFRRSYRPQTIRFSAYYEYFHQEEYRIEDELKYSLCNQIDKDILHYGQTMKAKNKRHGQTAMR